MATDIPLNAQQSDALIRLQGISKGNRWGGRRALPFRVWTRKVPPKR